MKNKRIHLLHPATVFLYLTLLLAVASWITSIYVNDGVENMLSPEGIRWLLRHVLPNYLHTPALGIVCIMFFGLGLAHYTRLLQAYKTFFTSPQQLTRKETHTLYVATICLFIYLLFLASITVGPFTLLQSATGTLVHSPFADGFIFLLSLGIAIASIIYGYGTQQLHTDKDIIAGMSCLYIKYNTYFVTLFSIVLFFSSLSYSQLIHILDINAIFIQYLFHTCCYLPFFIKKWR